MMGISNFKIRTDLKYPIGLTAWIHIFNSLDQESEKRVCVDEIEKEFPDFGKELRREIQQTLISRNFKHN